MRRPFLITVLLLGAWGCGLDPPPPDAEGRPGAMVSVGTMPEAVLRPGESAELAVPVVVADGFHVQANPPAQELLVPLELRIEGGDLGVDEVRYPPGRPYRLQGADEDLLTYEGTVAIEVRLEAPEGAAPGRRDLEGSLRYQACDERRCYAPASIPVKITADVQG